MEALGLFLGGAGLATWWLQTLPQSMLANAPAVGTVQSCALLLVCQADAPCHEVGGCAPVCDPNGASMRFAEGTGVQASKQ